jgi:outer membrane protein assembly factor BamB
VFTAGATGILTCLQASSGKKIWQRDLFKEYNAHEYGWGYSCSPLVVGDKVFVNPGGGNGNGLAAFWKKTGEPIWKSQDDEAGYSSPVAMTVQGIPQILFFTGKGLVSVHPDTGDLHWRFDWKTEYGANIATPIVVNNYVFISSNYDMGCAVVHVTRDRHGKLQGRPVYANKRMRNHYGTCVFYRDHLYGFDNSQLTCLEFKTGKTLWHKSGFGKGSLILAGGYLDPPALSGCTVGLGASPLGTGPLSATAALSSARIGYLIVLGGYGRLAIARASPKGFEPISDFHIQGSTFWNIPVLASGRLYVRDQDQLTCFDLRKAKEKK